MDTEQLELRAEAPAKVAAARAQAGLSLSEAGKRMGVSKQAIYAVESGRQPATLEWLHRFALAIGADPHDLDPRLATNRFRMIK